MKHRNAIAIAVMVTIVIATVWLSQSEHSSMDDQSEFAMQSLSFRQRILHASDLMDGVKAAVLQQDQQLLIAWQKKAVAVAKAAELSSQDIEFIASEDGLDYLRFHANRALFNDQLVKRYYSLDPIDDLKAKYPQARDLFDQADHMIAQRDAIIDDIAVTLSGSKPPSEAALQNAKQQWRQRVKLETQP